MEATFIFTTLLSHGLTLVAVEDLKQILSPPKMEDFHRGGGLGILNLHCYYGFKPKDLIKGEVFDHMNGTLHKSVKKLTPSDALMISDLSKKILDFPSAVEWAKAALQVAKSENQGAKVEALIKNQLKMMKALHDEMISKHGWLYGKEDHWGEATQVRVRLSPFRKEILEQKDVKKFVRLRDKYRALAATKGNLYLGVSQDEKPSIITPVIHQFLINETVRLCRGQGSRTPGQDAALKCKFLDRDNPWLKLGPFKYEVLNINPHVGSFKDFASPRDMRDLKTKAVGRMRPTPYNIGRKMQDYAKGRTSKVMYQHSGHGRHVDRLNRDIETAMGMSSVGRKKYDAENFQVMNYGIGGVINIHMDTKGKDDRTGTEEDQYGGLRLTTFMIYLSTVQAGGRTIFPQLGLTEKPTEGDALFWFAFDSWGNIDSRPHHGGCPVLVGNKWIANKWIKWLPQMFEYKCHKDNRIHFQPF